MSNYTMKRISSLHADEDTTELSPISLRVHPMQRFVHSKYLAKIIPLLLERNLISGLEVFEFMNLSNDLKKAERFEEIFQNLDPHQTEDSEILKEIQALVLPPRKLSKTSYVSAPVPVLRKKNNASIFDRTLSDGEDVDSLSKHMQSKLPTASLIIKENLKRKKSHSSPNLNDENSVLSYYDSKTFGTNNFCSNNNLKGKKIPSQDDLNVSADTSAFASSKYSGSRHTTLNIGVGP